MRVLRSCLLLVVLLIPAAAHAGDHRADAFAAPSYAYIKGSSNLVGWHISGAGTLKNHREWSFVGDLSAHFYETDGDKHLTQITFMGGPRRTWLPGRQGQPFVHFMALGAFYRSNGRLQVSNAAGAMAFGVGVDFSPGTHRATAKSLAVLGNSGYRFQADFIRPLATDLTWSARLSLGFVYRFHDH